MNTRTPFIFTVLVLACSGTAFAQGTVNFSNATSAYGTAVPDHLVRFSPLFAFPSGLLSSNFNNANLSGLRAQLYYGASTVSSPYSLTPVTDAPATFRASTSANVGAWLGGGRTLLGFNPGDTVHLNVVVWDINNAADPLQILGLFASDSGIFNYTIPAAGSPPTAYLPSGQQPFLWPPVPEPSVGALTGLGALALLLSKRARHRQISAESQSET